MNSAMWRTLCDEIPLEATPHELDAALRDAEDDDLTDNERAMIRYLAVLIRASFTSSPAPDVADLPALRRSTTGTDED
jgi:hypothetical protein